MANELEKKFFETFGIEPKYTYLVTDTFYTNNSHTYTATKDDLIDYFEGKNCGRYKVTKVYKNYPQISDSILLKLICIDFEENPYKCRGGVDITNVKEYILNEFIRDYEDDLYHDKQDIKHQVLTLFKEEVR